MKLIARAIFLISVLTFSFPVFAGLGDLLKPEHVKTYEKQREKLKKKLEPHLGAMTFEDDLNPEYAKQVELWKYWVSKVDIHSISAENNLANIQQILNAQGYSFQDKYYVLKGNEQAQSEFASCMLYQVTYRKKVVLKALKDMKKEKSLVPRVDDTRGEFDRAYQWAVNAWPESLVKSVEYCDSLVLAYYKDKKRRDKEVTRLMVDIIKLENPSLSDPEAYKRMKASKGYQFNLNRYNALWLDTEAFKAMQDDVASGVLNKREEEKRIAKAEREAKEKENYTNLMSSPIGKSLYEGCAVMLGKQYKSEIQVEWGHAKDTKQQQIIQDQYDSLLKSQCTCWSTNLVNAGHSDADLKRAANLMKTLSPNQLANDSIGMSIANAGMSCTFEAEFNRET